MSNNLEIYEKCRVVPDTALRTIEKGPLTGKSDINPMWRIKQLTELFGPCGFGWYTEIIKEWTEQGAKDEVMMFVKLKLYINYNGEWSHGIEGTGGNTLINNFTNAGLKNNDEALKMAETDALSVACKKLGIGADVYWNKDKTKYTENGDSGNQQKSNNLEKEIRDKLMNILYFAAKKDKNKAVELLEKYTSFTGRDGKEVPGISDINKLKDKRLNTTYDRVQKDYPELYAQVKELYENKMKEKKGA